MCLMKSALPKKLRVNSQRKGLTILGAFQASPAGRHMRTADARVQTLILAYPAKVSWAGEALKWNRANWVEMWKTPISGNERLSPPDLKWIWKTQKLAETSRNSRTEPDRDLHLRDQGCARSRCVVCVSLVSLPCVLCLSHQVAINYECN